MAIFWGVLGGLTVSAGIGISAMVGAGLNLGIRIGIDGSVQSVGASSSLLVVGCVVVAFTVLLYFGRSAWWTPIEARLSAACACLALVVIGNLLFSATFVTEIGQQPWSLAIPVFLSQSVAAYAFLGFAFASGVSELLERRKVHSSTEIIEAPRAG